LGAVFVASCFAFDFVAIVLVDVQVDSPPEWLFLRRCNGIMLLEPGNANQMTSATDFAAGRAGGRAFKDCCRLFWLFAGNR
jgi:hypothetical protein